LLAKACQFLRLWWATPVF